MKKFVEDVQVNDKYCIAVINHWTKPVKNEQGEYVFRSLEDKNENIGKHKGYANTVTVYLTDDGATAQIINISAGAIRKLYDLIVEIDKTESFEFIDV